jgi:hypothetical protein
MAGEDSIISHLIKHRAGDLSIALVNVGAAHPILLNDTFRLARKLRKKKRLKVCVSIDPRPDLAWLWRLLRPRDEFLNALVSDNESVEFYFNTFDSHNSSSSLTWAQGLANSFPSNSRVVKLEPTRTSLKKIYEGKDAFDSSVRHEIYSILIIDVEGFELDTLRSNDWSLHSPDLIVIEICFPTEKGLSDFSLNLLKNSETNTFLMENGYSYYGGNGFSQFYLKVD